MNNKSILLGLIVISFVAGSIMTGSMAYAKPVDPLIVINVAIADLQARMTTAEANIVSLLSRMTAVETVNTNQQTAINALTGRVTTAEGDVDALQTSMTAVETVNTNQQTQINAISTTGGSDCLHNVKPNGDLSNCWLAGSFLYKADLADANFTGATVYSSVFQSANLTGVNFTGKDLSGDHFGNAILIGVDLDGANLTNTTFTGADLTDITYAGCTGTPSGIPAVGTLPTCP